MLSASYVIQPRTRILPDIVPIRPNSSNPA
ncbi:unnamed protein product, partial [Rotaria sordida]